LTTPIAKIGCGAQACRIEPPIDLGERGGDMRRGIVGCVAAMAVSALGQAAGAQALIGGLPNVEDMVATADGRWVVASAMKGGGQPQGALYLVDTGSRAVVKADLTAAPGAPLCRDGFRPDELAPHGLAIRSDAAGEILFVVNHGGRESVERFRLTAGASAPRLVWEGCVPLPAGMAGNGVAVAGDAVFVTGSAGSGAPGALLRWTEAGGWRALPGSAHRMERDRRHAGRSAHLRGGVARPAGLRVRRGRGGARAIRGCRLHARQSALGGGRSDPGRGPGREAGGRRGLLLLDRDTLRRPVGPGAA
jgi:hypothetical protein